MSDTDSDANNTTGGATIIGKVSWTRYLRILAIYLFIAYILALILPTKAMGAIATVYIFFFLLFVGHCFSIRSFLVLASDDGVWIQYGIVPWRKGSYFIRWDNLESAYYYTGFINWVTNSYKIILKHKYTNSSNIVAGSIWRGRRVCEIINSEISKRRRT